MSITWTQAILLGVVQGLTEFLPVSSTAHLALAQKLLPGFSQPGLLFDVLLHLGTLAAVTFYLRERLVETARGAFSSDSRTRRRAWRLVGLLALAVVATAAITFPLKKVAVEGMSDFRRIGFALLGTAVLLLVTQRVGTRRGEAGRSVDDMSPLAAVLVGACQAASAVFHGFSRSGNTISVGLFTGLSRRAAAEFSFLLSIPTILGAAIVENVSAYRHAPQAYALAGPLPQMLVGMAVAGVVGYLAVAALLRVVVSMKLLPFSAYCAALGLVLVVWNPA